MKLWKVWYLWIIVVLFVVLWVPYFENISNAWFVIFFGTKHGFVGLYPILLFLWVIQWFLIAVYIQSLLKDIAKEDVQKFDL